MDKKPSDYLMEGAANTVPTTDFFLMPENYEEESGTLYACALGAMYHAMTGKRRVIPTHINHDKRFAIRQAIEEKCGFNPAEVKLTTPQGQYLPFTDAVEWVFDNETGADFNRTIDWLAREGY